jgi:hypothetical protein
MRRLHHKALRRRRPRDQMRYGSVFKHTMALGQDQLRDTALPTDSLVKLVYKGRLDYLRLMYGRGGGYRGGHDDVVVLLMIAVRYSPC